MFLDGDTEKYKKTKKSLLGEASDRVDEIAKIQGNIYKMSADRGLHYTSFTSVLNVGKLDVSQNDATLTAKEIATRTLVSNGSKDPILTKEERSHRFYFTLNGNQWVLFKDEDLDKVIPAEPEPGTELGKIKNLPDPSTSLNNIKKQDKENQDRNKLTRTFGSGEFMATATSGTYNPSTAINYVRSYWGPSTSNYNSAYRIMYDQNSGNVADCTNFISQAMNWGGWQHKGGWYQNTSYWWYDPATPWEPTWGNQGQSWSWINAHYFNFFARNSGRTIWATSWSQFLQGDILQMDFAPTAGVIEHSMLITKIENGNLFITQHSNNYIDKNFQEIYNSNPGAAYYGLLPLYQY